MQLNQLLFMYCNNNIVLSESEGAMMLPMLNMIPCIPNLTTRYLTMTDISRQLLLCLECSPRLVNSVMNRMRDLDLPRESLSYQQNLFFQNVANMVKVGQLIEGLLVNECPLDERLCALVDVLLFMMR